MKETLALIGALGALAYLLYQTFTIALQPIFSALSGKLH